MEVRGRHVELRAKRREARGGMGRATLKVDTRAVCGQADRLAGLSVYVTPAIRYAPR